MTSKLTDTHAESSSSHITKYEMTELVAHRATLISHGAHILLSDAERDGCTDPLILACREFALQRIDARVQRRNNASSTAPVSVHVRSMIPSSNLKHALAHRPNANVP